MATKKQREAAEAARVAGLNADKKVTLPPVAGAGDDLGLGTGLDLGTGDELEDVLKDTAPAAQAAPEVDTESDAFKAAVAAQVAAMRKEEEEFVPKVDVILEDAAPNSKEDKIAIMIDEVEGMPNYEPVGVNGKIYQIKRGVKVNVPASVVHVLENAIATRTVQSTDQATGELISTARDYSAIPWRRV